MIKNCACLSRVYTHGMHTYIMCCNYMDGNFGISKDSIYCVHGEFTFLFESF